MTSIFIFIVSFFMISLISAFLRMVIGGLIGSHKVHESSKIINRIVVGISTLFFIGSTLISPDKPKISYIIVIFLSGFATLLLFRYSDIREIKKQGKKKPNKYLWEDLFDSI